MTEVSTNLTQTWDARLEQIASQAGNYWGPVVKDVGGKLIPELLKNPMLQKDSKILSSLLDAMEASKENALGVLQRGYAILDAAKDKPSALANAKFYSHMFRIAAKAGLASQEPQPVPVTEGKKPAWRESVPAAPGAGVLPAVSEIGAFLNNAADYPLISGPKGSTHFVVAFLTWLEKGTTPSGEPQPYVRGTAPYYDKKMQELSKNHSKDSIPSDLDAIASTAFPPRGNLAELPKAVRYLEAGVTALKKNSLWVDGTGMTRSASTPSACRVGQSYPRVPYQPAQISF